MGVSYHTHDPEEARVKLHRNAKTTPSQRLLMVRRYQEEGWDVDSMAEAVGVSGTWRCRGAALLASVAWTASRISHCALQLRC